jgi:hypothetical protein
MGLHRDQIDLEKNTIRILQDKTQKSQRWISIQKEQ